MWSTVDFLWIAGTCVLCALGATCVHAEAPYPPDKPSSTSIDRPPQVYALPEDYVLEHRDSLNWSDNEDIDVQGTVGFGWTMPSVVDSWSLGTRNWRYVSSSGYGVTLGNEQSRAPAWSRSVRLAGVGIHRIPGQDSEPADSWDYALAVGALDDSTDTMSSGSLSYGPAAYDASVKYGISPSLSLASRTQGTSDLFTFGLGGEYSMNDWGSWALGVSRARRLVGQGWRYQLGYKVDIFNDWRLSWVNEQRTAGYADLSSYRQQALGCGCIRNQWQLSLPLGRWGKLSGSYERLNRTLDEPEQTVGLAQRFWYSPQLRVRLEANRNIVTGAYGVGAKFSLPLH